MDKCVYARYGSKTGVCEHCDGFFLPHKNMIERYTRFPQDIAELVCEDTCEFFTRNPNFNKEEITYTHRCASYKDCILNTLYKVLQAGQTSPVPSDTLIAELTFKDKGIGGAQELVTTNNFVEKANKNMNTIFHILNDKKHAFTSYFEKSRKDAGKTAFLKLNVYLYRDGEGLCKNTVYYESIEDVLKDCTEDWVLFWGKNLTIEKEMFEKYHKIKANSSK